MTRSHRLTIPFIFFIVHILLSTFYLIFGRIFLDSGFYLNACREIISGHLPYRDFFFVQAPLYPYIYGYLLKPFGISLLSSSSLSILLGGLVLLISMLLAQRLGGRMASIVTGLALICAPVHIYSFASVKLYALSGLFFTLAVFFASFSTSAPLLALSSLTAVLATSTRLTLLPGSAIIILFTIYRIFRFKTSHLYRALILLVPIVSALGIIGPFIAIDPDALMYNLIGIHTSASSGPFLFGWINKLKVLAQLSIEYSIISCAMILMLGSFIGRRLRDRISVYEVSVFMAVGAVTIAHLKANWFSTDYQTIVMPALASVVLARISRLELIKQHGIRVIQIACILGLATSSFRASHPIWKGSGSALSNLIEIGSFIRSHSAPDETIAGCSAVFAIQADRATENPFGGAPFTFTPHWTDSQCQRFGGINTSILTDMLDQRRARLLVFEDDSFSVGFPGFFPVSSDIQSLIHEAIHRNYRKLATFPDLGNGALELHIYERR